MGKKTSELAHPKWTVVHKQGHTEAGAPQKGLWIQWTYYGQVAGGVHRLRELYLYIHWRTGGWMVVNEDVLDNTKPKSDVNV